MSRFATLFLLFTGLAACKGDDKDTGTPATTDPGGDADHDGVRNEDDCDPTSSDAHPGATEICDGIDNNCDGDIDEQFDADADGYLVDDPGCRALGAELDCDDGNADIHPGAVEQCDGIDHDCSGVAGDGPDADQDGASGCDDCDDSDPLVKPGQAEACDAVDNDCNGVVDDEWDLDGDGDSSCQSDCDDGDPANAGILPEICDLRDNDCDGEVDEDFDLDGDGIRSCQGDCDDSDPLVNNKMPEICDGKDTDCNGIDEDAGDLDGDGFDLCTGLDCDDRDAAAFPGGVEACDGVDNDCNGLVDELPECSGCTSDSGWWFCTSARSWLTAEATCEGFGTQLVVVTGDADNTALTTLGTTYFGVARYWIGLSDTAVEGTFAWIDGSALGYSAWTVGEPNGGQASDCVTIKAGTSTWGDADCATAQAFVCK